LHIPAFAEIINKVDPIVIFANEDKAPKIWMENGEPKGILVDMMSWINKRSEQQYELKFYPWKRAYKLAVASQGGIIGISKTKHRSKVFDFSDTIFLDDIMLVVPKGKEFSFENLEDLQGKTIAVLRGSVFGLEYEKGLSDGIFTSIETNSPSQGFHMIREGRADAVLIGPSYAGAEMVFDSNPKLIRDQYIILKKPFVNDPNYIAFAKTLNRKSQIEEINGFIKLGWDSGDFDKIIKSYLSKKK
jgi:ABC-type amino acid transport substrate-binding protein